MKKITVTVCLLLCVCFIASCSIFKAQPKEFTKAGMTITLTDDFNEHEIVTQTVCFVSYKYTVTALREEFTLFEQAEISTDITLKEYAQMTLTANSVTSDISESDGLTSFTYEKEVNGKRYKYFACVFKGTDAYWLIQFSSTVDLFSEAEPKFIEWAKTVKFA